MEKRNNEILVNKLADKISVLSKNKAIFIVGITGLDASGKSKLGGAISDKLLEAGRNVFSISGDSFQFPRDYKENFVEKTWAIQHIKRTIDFKGMVERFLKPILKKPASIKIDGINYDSGEKIESNVPLKYPLIVVIESIYLFQPSILRYIDYKIFLDINVDKALSRAKLRSRDLELYGDAKGIEKKYSKKNFAGYVFFDKTVQPKQYADVIIDNNDWKNPKVEKGLI